MSTNGVERRGGLPPVSDVVPGDNRMLQRILATGEVYVMCNECGGKLWSVDAMPGERHDRDRKCPFRNRFGDCEPKDGIYL